MHTTQRRREQQPPSIAIAYNRPSSFSPNSASSSINNVLNANMSSSFQRHPLLAASSSSSSLSGDAQLVAARPRSSTRRRSSLSPGNAATKHSSTSSSSTLSAVSQKSTTDPHLSPLDAAAARRASDSQVYLTHDDQEQDAEDVEADLRFPSFARRPSQHLRGRRPSPLRNSAFGVPSGMASVSALDLSSSDEEDDGEDRPTRRDGHMNAHASRLGGEDSYDIFHLDEHNAFNRPVWHDEDADDNDVDVDDEASYGDLASPLFSVAPSFASHTTRRTSDQSSAADLDMIWDDEDDDSRLNEKTKAVRRMHSGSVSATLERRTSTHKQQQPSSAPVEQRDVHGTQVEALPAAVALPFARKSGELYAIQSPRQQTISTPSSALLHRPMRKTSNMSIGTTATATINTKASPSHTRRHSAIHALHLHHHPAEGRKRSGTDPLRRSQAPLQPVANECVDARQVRSVSASPRRRSRLDDRFAELLETIRI